MNKKNLLWLLSLLLIVSVSFVSCNKDDDDNDVDLNTAIIGTWKSVSHVLYIDGVKDDDESEISDDDNNTVYEFKSDGTGSSVIYTNLGDVSNTFTWKIDGSNLILTHNNNGETKVQITIKGNTLIITSESIISGEMGKLLVGDDKEHTVKIINTFAKQ